MTITITHRGMELTPAIRAYAEEKMFSLEKYAHTIQHIDVEVGFDHHHQQKGDIFLCGVSVNMDGNVIRVERQAEDLYKAIDKVRDHLRNELAEEKNRLVDRKRDAMTEESIEV